MSDKKLPATIPTINWPKELTADVDEMRQGAMSAWRDLVKVSERKAPITDVTKLQTVMVNVYAKQKGSLIHQMALLWDIAKGGSSSNKED